MPAKKIILLFICLASSFGIFSQSQYQSLRCKWIKIETTPSEIDSLSIEASTIQIKTIRPSGFDVKNIKIDYDINNNTINFISLDENTNLQEIDSVFICYRVFPFNFSAPYYGEKYIEFDSSDYLEAYHLELPEIAPKEKREELFATEGIQKTGSLTRGISIGNTQNVFVNSALNLQLDGKLSEDITLTAAISDQNIPFQPEGNTQQLQDFDKVYIQFNHKNGSLTAGDIFLKNRPDSYFLKFRKNVQGVKLNATLGDTTGNYVQTQIGVAVAKGQFYSQTLEIQEGVLGPYRLSGPGIEKFIVIIANSERVFLDGKQLQRGYNYDYIIDYNTAELTLTNKIVLTKYSRVRVDFEYSSQNYSRSIFQASHTQKAGKFNFGFNFYQEKDNKNNPILTSLNEENILDLSSAGDQIEKAFSQNIDTLTAFDINRIIYTSVDTVDNGQLYTIFRRATEDDHLFLSIGFSDVGSGNGNYRLASSTTNGRVYEWIAPVNGQSQGDYEPVIQLAAPNKRQLITFRTTYELSDKEKIYSELAVSNYDKNLFSTLDAEDNKGFATKFGYVNKGRKFGLVSNYQWFSDISIEFDQKHFNPIDRFRNVDYDRDWSVNNQVASEDIIIIGSIGLRKDKENDISYYLSKRKRGDNEGLQHRVKLNKSIGFFQLNSTAFLMENDQQNTVSEWHKLNIDLSIPGKRIIPGYVYSVDKNKVFQSVNDSIISSAMNFEEHKFYLKNAKKSKLNYKLDYSVREDKTPLLGELEDENLAHTFNLSIKKNTNKNYLNVLFTYRKLENLRTQTNTPNEETIMGRVDWNTTFLNKVIRSSLNFNTASGRERKREFVFVQVATGLGTHTWRDENEDGIQDLSEFYIAINPDEKNYAKFFVPTSEFIQAYSSSINYRLNIQPPRKWLKEKGIKSFLGKFSNVSALAINTKTTVDNVAERLTPFFYNIEDDNLLASNSLVRSTLFYNKRNPKSGLELKYFKARNKQLLNNGFDDISQFDYNFTVRVNFTKTLNIKTKFNYGEKENISDIFENRNYKLDKREINPIITIQPNKNLRFTTSYFYKIKNNLSSELISDVEEIKNSQFNELEFALRLVKASKISAQFNFKLTDIKIEGAFTGQSANSALGYEMLEALQPGKNISWKVNINSKLMNGLQLNLNYSGRKPQDSEVIHIGRVQVTALF